METDKCLGHKTAELFRHYVVLSRDIKWKTITEPKGEFRNWKNRQKLTIQSYPRT